MQTHMLDMSNRKDLQYDSFFFSFSFFGFQVSPGAILHEGFLFAWSYQEV